MKQKQGKKRSNGRGRVGRVGRAEQELHAALMHRHRLRLYVVSGEVGCDFVRGVS